MHSYAAVSNDGNRSRTDHAPSYPDTLAIAVCGGIAKSDGERTKTLSEGFSARMEPAEAC